MTIKRTFSNDKNKFFCVNSMALVLSLLIGLTVFNNVKIYAETEVNNPRCVEFVTEKFSVNSDITYKYLQIRGETEELKLDVYRAEREISEKHPVILLVHGGGLTGGDKSDSGLTKKLAEDFAKMGYVAVVPNYRLSERVSQAALESAMEDINQAINWIVKNGDTYGADCNKIFLIGNSAGADIVVNLCYSNLYEGEFRKRILGVVDMCGGGLYYNMYVGKLPCCLIIHGTADSKVPCHKSEMLSKMLVEKGIDVNFYPLEGVEHALISEYDKVRNRIVDFLATQFL